VRQFAVRRQQLRGVNLSGRRFHSGFGAPHSGGPVAWPPPRRRGHRDRAPRQHRAHAGHHGRHGVEGLDLGTNTGGCAITATAYPAAGRPCHNPAGRWTWRATLQPSGLPIPKSFGSFSVAFRIGSFVQLRQLTVAGRVTDAAHHAVGAPSDDAGTSQRLAAARQHRARARAECDVRVAVLHRVGATGQVCRTGVDVVRRRGAEAGLVAPVGRLFGTHHRQHGLDALPHVRAIAITVVVPWARC
jgi:hypothetical protein